MVENKHITKIIVAIVTIAVILCVLAMALSDKLSGTFGGDGVSMAYESRLFDTDEVIQINILMDENDWNNMLDNAIAEEFVPCDVVINGQRINNVGIRPKGNTSLSSIAMDPTTNRYSFKLEFDQYVKGQTCFGLDKLILNNNYADASNMKEAIIYDMYQYMGVEASLYNFAEIFVNGEYWGVYLALEAVEDSFLLRNFGTQDGKMYKPDSMNMGDRDEGDSEGGERPEGEFPEPGESDGESGGSEGDSRERADSRGSNGENAGDAQPAGNETAADEIQAANGAVQPAIPEAAEELPATDETQAANGAVQTVIPEAAEELPVTDETEIPAVEDGQSEIPTEEGDSNGDSNGDSAGESAGGPGGFGPGGDLGGETQNDAGGDSEGESQGGPGGFGPGGGGANLNYTDDDLGSYSTIWEGEVEPTTDADHRRVVTALKHISEGNELEKYMNIDNLLRFMAVHVFSVNNDSLSGGMAHNYYLYEYKGQLDMFPWDYNLSFGGMGGGFGSDGASGMINDAIDTPFNSTRFFDALLNNEEYLGQYHEYLRQLTEEYVDGGRFDEVYQRIRNQIDHLVETDPNAFYDYEEYQAGADMLYETIKLRAKSIEGQLDGSIPSTDTAQRQDQSALIDASGIDVDAMGEFGMGGGPGESDGESRDGESAGDSAAGQGNSEVPAGSEAVPGNSGVPGDSAAGQRNAEVPADFAEVPENAEALVDSTAQDNEETTAADSENNTESAMLEGGENTGNAVPAFEGEPPAGFPGIRNGGSEAARNKNLVTFAICLGALILCIGGIFLFARRKK